MPSAAVTTAVEWLTRQRCSLSSGGQTFRIKVLVGLVPSEAEGGSAPGSPPAAGVRWESLLSLSSEDVTHLRLYVRMLFSVSIVSPFIRTPVIVAQGHPNTPPIEFLCMHLLPRKVTF